MLAAIAALAFACSWQDRVNANSAEAIRPPAVAGQFYPGDADTLGRAIDTLLSHAIPGRTEAPVAILAPHAGYVYSGQIAADAFSQVRDRAFDVVVIIGPNHTTAGFERIGLLPGSGLRTPLGVATLDREIGAALMRADPDLVSDADVHRSEHSIEVQVPFVQRLWPRARIVAIVMGTEDPARCTRFGRALAHAVKGRRALLVASSDLSHYPAASAARRVDVRTLETVATLDASRVDAVTRRALEQGTPGLATAACGRAPILAVIAAARELGATRSRVISYANAADVPVGDADRVVGYGAVVFSTGPAGIDTSALKPPEPGRAEAPLSAADKDSLLAIARTTVSDYLTTRTLPLARSLPALETRRQGAFVTIRKKGELRGCIGRFEGDRPLPQFTSLIAYESAFHDPRFEPLTVSELNDVTFEISLLTTPRPVDSPETIVPGRDGVILEKKGRRAVFLPQVATEQGWNRETMLENLCEKGGLPDGCWREGASLSTFQAEVFGEKVRGR